MCDKGRGWPMKAKAQDLFKKKKLPGARPLKSIFKIQTLMNIIWN